MTLASEADRPYHYSAGAQRSVGLSGIHIAGARRSMGTGRIQSGCQKALADHGGLGLLLPADGGDSEEVLARFTKAGIDVDALAAQLQDEGANAIVSSWHGLIEVIASKGGALAKAG